MLYSKPPNFLGLSGTPIEIAPSDLAGPLTALKDHTLSTYDPNEPKGDPYGMCIGDLYQFTKRFKESTRKGQKQGKEKFATLCTEFGTLLANFIVRRTGPSCWMNIRILDREPPMFKRKKR
ncbi:MAG: hypothetical protein Q9221_003603 [Calogaya cf. arnoldii]